MKFALLVHPVCEYTKTLMALNGGVSGTMLDQWGSDVFGFARHGFRQVMGCDGAPPTHTAGRVSVIDHMKKLTSLRDCQIDGRLYEIPMHAREVLQKPSCAIAYMEQAIDKADRWGARLVGLGSMTGIVGNRGQYLADRGPIAVTTGNSLTAYASLRNLEYVCRETGVDLAQETVALIGIPGSITSALATMLAPVAGRVLLVASRQSANATALAKELDAELLFDIPQALSKSRVIISATSSGNCIDSNLLLPGSIVLDVAVPADVRRSDQMRDDVLLLTAGYSKVPSTMNGGSSFLKFFQGIIPSCLAETMVLALEGRQECLSVGRVLKQDRISEIGKLAESHGFEFTFFRSFGLPVDSACIASFRKARAILDRKARVLSNGRMEAGNALSNTRFAELECWSPAVLLESDASCASEVYCRYINPVIGGFGGESGIVRTFVRGEGAELFDENGVGYLDFVAGFGAVNLGHNHPTVLHAVQSALQRKAPGFSPASINPLATGLAEQLVSLTPPGLDRVFFVNSGTEAVEAAIKLVRAASDRDCLLSCEGSFHGKTLGSLSVTSNADLRRPFGPLLPNCDKTPYGDVESLETFLKTRRYAAFIVEPIQGEGGMIVPPTGYLKSAQEICNKTGTLMIVDEVQTGMGRTGKFLACEHENVQPDVLTLAKSLGGGIAPLGAMLTRRDLWDRCYGTLQTALLHTSTFGGGSFACAAGLGALRALREENLIEHAAKIGDRLRRGLKEICRRSPILEEVRGKGLMLAIVFKPLPPSIVAHFKSMGDARLSSYLVPKLDQFVGSIPAAYAMHSLLDIYHIHTQTARSNPHVLRIQPPLTISEKQVDRFLESLQQTDAGWALVSRVADSIMTKSLGEFDESQRKR